MKLDINFDKNEETATLTFFVEEFKQERDFNLAIAIITTFCGDFALEPELEITDLAEIVGKADEKKSSSFTFFINEDGVEAEIN